MGEHITRQSPLNCRPGLRTILRIRGFYRINDCAGRTVFRHKAKVKKQIPFRDLQALTRGGKNAVRVSRASAGFYKGMTAGLRHGSSGSTKISGAHVRINDPNPLSLASFPGSRQKSYTGPIDLHPLGPKQRRTNSQSHQT
jgi:hypothetical protein